MAAGSPRGRRPADACHAPSARAAPASKSAVSRIGGALRAEREAWRPRSPAELHGLGLSRDAPALRGRGNGKVVSAPALGVVAVPPAGQKQRLARERCPGGETFEAWKGCLDALVGRGSGRRRGA